MEISRDMEPPGEIDIKYYDKEQSKLKVLICTILEKFYLWNI